MSRIFFMDTSYVIAMNSENDQHRAVAHEVTSRLKPTDKIFYTEAIMYESLNALSKQSFRASVLKFFDKLAQDPNAELLHTTVEQFNHAMQYFRKHPDKEWSLVDCVSFLAMKSKKIRYALTADKHYEQAGFYALLRTPSALK